MKPISLEQIEKYAEEVDNLTDEKVEALIDQFSQNQPIMLAYLLTAFEEELTSDDNNWLLYTGVKIWYIVKNSVNKLPSITENQINEVDEQNEKMLDYLSQESEENFTDFANNLLANHNQSHLLEFALMESLASEEEQMIDDMDEGDISDNQSLIFMGLKNMIDCFDKYVA
jgi:hypothetical protein